MKKNHKTEINIDEMENKIRILIRHLHALHPFEDVFPLSIFMCLCDVCVCVCLHLSVCKKALMCIWRPRLMLGIILNHSFNSVRQGCSVEPSACLLMPLARLASLFGGPFVSRGKSYRWDAIHTLRLHGFQGVQTL